MKIKVSEIAAVVAWGVICAVVWKPPFSLLMSFLGGFAMGAVKAYGEKK